MAEWIFIIFYLMYPFINNSDVGLGAIGWVVMAVEIIAGTLIVVALGYVMAKLLKRKTVSIQIIFWAGLIVSLYFIGALILNYFLIGLNWRY